MSPNERSYVKEYAHELLRLAKYDLVAASALKRSPEVRGEIVLFHVQQTIEKALKAVLCWRGIAVPWGHDLLATIQKLDPKDLPPGGFALHDLTPYATIRRYEEGVEKIPPEEIDLALTQAQAVLAWAEKRVSR
jgi:HEPN domain-containing protein